MNFRSLLQLLETLPVKLTVIHFTLLVHYYLIIKYFKCRSLCLKLCHDILENPILTCRSFVAISTWLKWLISIVINSDYTNNDYLQYSTCISHIICLYKTLYCIVLHTKYTSIYRLLLYSLLYNMWLILF